ncbi:MAG: histone deacetylase [Deltaproteobacteria bacterium]|nr:histone deacetylase [Deltaproteobacteria bacterium]
MLLISDERMLLHDPGSGHPECPDRLRAVTEALEGVEDSSWAKPEPATREQIERVHTVDHVDKVEGLRGRTGALDMDTTTSPGSVEAAYLAAGAALDAVTEVVSGHYRHAWALVRPPGHHAEAEAAMGFCLFNNVAIAAAHARAELGCERVLIVDWDVHHGNGTQRSFYERDDVLFFSLHRYPFYPGTGVAGETGRGAGEGYTVNVPFPGGQGDGDYLAACEQLLVPIADAYAPDLVLVSAGFDAHRRDPLGGMEVTEDGYAAMASLVQGIAQRHAEGRVVLLLEGGYDLEALGGSVRRCVETLNGAPVGAVDEPSPLGEAIIQRLWEHHRGNWGL